jgi:hypothetical protein
MDRPSSQVVLAADLPAPEVLAREIVDELEIAIGEFAAIAEALDSQ